MQFHILGICGTFMGGLAILASELKCQVSGSDNNVYPPMSTQLENYGIKLIQGFEENQLDNLSAETVLIVGNVMKRGYPVIEAILNRRIPMLSGPEWMAKYVLPKRHVLAVTGTHGKTTTASMLAWILEYAGLKPGFLIGGVPNNFNISARLGEGECFVLEADEYDSAFFDKRSKFIHSRATTLIINNIEFDHADIFPNLAAIQNQFHHLIRTIPGNGLIIYPRNESTVDEVLKMGCWTPTVTVATQADNRTSGWYAENQTPAGDGFDICYDGKQYGRIEWSLLGQHNIANALAAIAAANHVGASVDQAIAALKQFQGVKRRLEIKGVRNNITVYDDFAHHPTAISTTLNGLRAKLGEQAKILAVLDIRSNTMRSGYFKDELPASVKNANEVYFFKSPEITWDLEPIWQATGKTGGVFGTIDNLVEALSQSVKQQDHVVFMSNGGFGGIHHKFLQKL